MDLGVRYLESTRDASNPVHFVKAVGRRCSDVDELHGCAGASQLVCLCGGAAAAFDVVRRWLVRRHR